MINGLALPSLVLIGGATKPVSTEVPQSEYRKIDANRKDYRDTHRVKKSSMPDWWPSV